MQLARNGLDANSFVVENEHHLKENEERMKFKLNEINGRQTNNSSTMEVH